MLISTRDDPGMPSPTRRSSAVPSWLVGLVAATAALIALGFVSVGFFASFGGLVIAGALALMIGVAAAGAADPDRAGRNAAVVAFYVLVLAALYFLLLPALAGPQPPGARGGPGVYPPPQPRGGPGVYPPQR
jgi:hypothetical protein